MLGSGKLKRSPSDSIPAQPGLLPRDCKLWDYADDADQVSVCFKSLKPPVSVYMDLDAGTFIIENEQGDFNGYVSFKEMSPKCGGRKNFNAGKYKLQQGRRDRPVESYGELEAEQRKTQRGMGRRRPSTMHAIQVGILLDELENGFELHETDKGGTIVKTKNHNYRVRVDPHC